jgi:hypothetical protein
MRIKQLAIGTTVAGGKSIRNLWLRRSGLCFATERFVAMAINVNAVASKPSKFIICNIDQASG